MTFAFIQPDFTSQQPSAVKNNIENCIGVVGQIGAAFNVAAKTAPDMTVSVDKGTITNGTVHSTVAASSVSFAAPTTSERIDLISLQTSNNAIIKTTGTEGGGVPDTPSGNLPLASVTLQTATTLIINSMITDLRSAVILSSGGGGTAPTNVVKNDEPIQRFNPYGANKVLSSANDVFLGKGSALQTSINGGAQGDVYSESLSDGNYNAGRQIAVAGSFSTTVKKSMLIVLDGDTVTLPAVGGEFWIWFVPGKEPANVSACTIRIGNVTTSLTVEAAQTLNGKTIAYKAKTSTTEQALEMEWTVVAGTENNVDVSALEYYSSDTNIKTGALLSVRGGNVYGKINALGGIDIAGVHTLESLDVTGDAEIGGALDVTGDVVAASSVQAGSLDVTGAAEVGGALDVTGAVVAGSLDVTGAAEVGGALDVTGAVVAASSVQAASLDLTGDAEVGGALDVTGTTTSENLTISNAAAIAALSIDGLAFPASVAAASAGQAMHLNADKTELIYTTPWIAYLTGSEAVSDSTESNGSTTYVRRYSGNNIYRNIHTTTIGQVVTTTDDFYSDDTLSTLLARRYQI